MGVERSSIPGRTAADPAGTVAGSAPLASTGSVVGLDLTGVPVRTAITRGTPVDGVGRVQIWPGPSGAVIPSAVDDPREHLADRVPRSTEDRPAAVARRGSIPPSVVRSALGRGAALADATRAGLEHRFGHDLSAVRIYTGDGASRAARRLAARAFTIGDDIVFSAGAYRAAGDELLAHEVAHVVAGDGVDGFAMRAPDTVVSPVADQEPVPFWFTVRITRALDPDALLIELVKQFYRLPADADAEAERIRRERGLKWEGAPPTITAQHLAQRSIRVRVRDSGLAVVPPGQHRERVDYVESLAEADRDAVNDEADRQFWENTRYRPGELLGNSTEDREMAPYWHAVRDEVVRQRQAIDTLPPHIREAIFIGSGPPVSPQAYPAVLRVAARLQSLSPDEVAGYGARVRGRTGDWAEVEASVERYVAERVVRRRTGEQRERLATPLTRQEALYRRYRDYVSTLRRAAASAATPMGLGATLQVTGEFAQLDADLRAAGFAGVGGFEAAIVSWRAAFVTGAAAVAGDLLDRYDAELVAAERRFRAAGAGADLHRQLTPARRHFEEGDRIRDEFFASGGTAMPLTSDEMGASMAVLGRRNEQRSLGETAVAGLGGGTDPVLADPDLPREELARLPATDVVPFLMRYVADRRRDIATTRGNLATESEMVFDLPDLMPAAYRDQDIDPGSIFDMIVQDHIADERRFKVATALVMAVVAIALGIASAGTGTAAVLAATAAAGVGVAQAVHDFRRYERESAAHGAKLLSDEPSFAWVIVSVVGAGLDLGGVVGAFRASAGLRGAVESFNETRDLTALGRQLDALGDVDRKLRDAVRVGAQAQLAEETRATALLAEWFPAAARGSLFGADLAVEFTVRLTFAAYLTARRGIRSFRRFLLQQEARAVLGDVGALTPAQMTRIGAAYEEAVAAASRIAAHGRTLGMTDEQVQLFFRLWSRNERLTAEQLMAQMDEWTAGIGGGAGRYRTAPDIIIDSRSRALLPDVDQRIAGTGGIEGITAARTAEDGFSVTVEGELRTGMARRLADVGPDRPMAPNFNASGKLRSAKELGLSDDWELLHLWGPGFGDEAAAGMMRGPKAVNHVWQNQGIEAYLRQLAAQARQEGGALRLRATATAWGDPTPSGWRIPGGELFLRRAEYRIEIIVPGRGSRTVTVTVDVAEPPTPRVLAVGFDPPHATNPADLLDGH